MSFYRGEVGACHWTVVIGTLSDEDVQAFADNIRLVGGQLHRPTSIIDFAHDIAMPNPMQRKLVTDAVASIERKNLLSGHAVVSNSTVARGMLAVVNWFTKPTFPERVFGDPASGLDWLTKLDPAVSPERVLTDVHKNVPGFSGLRWR